MKWSRLLGWAFVLAVAAPASALAQSGRTHALIVVGIGVFLSSVHRPDFMFRRAIDTVKLEIAVLRRIDDVVACSGRDHYRDPVADFMALPVQPDRAFSCLEANELVEIVHLFADFLARLQTHQYELAVLCRVEHIAVQSIALGRGFNVGHVPFHAAASCCCELRHLRLRDRRDAFPAGAEYSLRLSRAWRGRPADSDRVDNGRR